MVKVLYCASVWAHIRNFHLPYIREMEAEGLEVHVAASGIPIESGLARTHGLPIRKSIFAPGNLLAVFKIANLIRKERFDLIYVHTTLAAFLCRIALWLSAVSGVRLIYVCHGYFFDKDRQGLKPLFYLLCERMLAGLTDVLVLMNKEDYDSAIRYGLGADIRFCHGMGIVPERYILPTARESGDKTVFLCVGELSARKNQGRLLHAFAQALKEIPGSELWLAGDGGLRKYYENLAKKLNLTEHVRFLGHIEDVSALYADADALVSASRCEGLPFCVMEGLYFGLPLILSDIKGHRDLVEHGRNGMLFNSDLAGCMTALGLSAEERERLSANARLPEEYLIEATMQEFRQIIGLPVHVPAAG